MILHSSQLTTASAKVDHLSTMSERPLDDLQQQVIEFASATEAPEQSFLMRRMSLTDPDNAQSLIDGLTLSLISFCYHRHPRGENVHEIMEELESARPDSEQSRELERRADDAAALQIPFIVNLNRLVEEYYHLRRRLESIVSAGR